MPLVHSHPRSLVGCVDWSLVKKTGSGAHELIYTYSKQKLETGNNKIKQLPLPPTKKKKKLAKFISSFLKKKKKKKKNEEEKKKRRKKKPSTRFMLCVTSKLPAVCISILTEYVGTVKDVWAGLA